MLNFSNTLIFILFTSLYLIQSCNHKSLKDSTTKESQSNPKIIEQFYEDSNPKVLRIRAFIDDNKKYNGNFEEYYKSGKIKVKTTFKNHNKNGKYYKYFESGQLEALEVYKEGKNDSISTFYYENGKVEKLKEFQNGMQSGVYKAFNRDGVLLQEYNFLNGEKHGEQKVYYKNGKLKSLSYFKNGKGGAGLKMYDENGLLKDYGYTMTIKEKNTVLLDNNYVYQIYINKKDKPIKVYFGDLDDDKFLNNQLFEMYWDDNCKCYPKTFYVPSGGSLIAPITFTAVININESQQIFLIKKIKMALTNY